MSKICSSCGTSNEDSSKFCSNCGSSSFSSSCPQCGQTLNPNVRFCANCGFDTKSQAFAAQQPEQIPPVASVVPEQPPVTPVQQPVQQPVFPAQPNSYVQPPIQNYAAPQTASVPANKKPVALIIAIIAIILAILCGTFAVLKITGVLDKDSTSVSASKDKDKDKDDSSTSDETEKTEKTKATKAPAKTTVKTTTTAEETEEPSIDGDIDSHGIFTDSKFNHGYQPAIAQMMYGVQENSFESFVAAYPDCVAQYEETQLKTQADKDKFINDIYSKYSASVGENFKFKMSTKSETELTDLELKNVATYVSGTYKGSIDITKGYNVTVTGTATGASGSGPVEITIKCILVDGKWYVIE